MRVRIGALIFQRESNSRVMVDTIISLILGLGFDTIIFQMESIPRVRVDTIIFQMESNPSLILGSRLIVQVFKGSLTLRKKRISLVENRGGARIRVSTLGFGLIL